jgi:hypothetical protein
LTFMEVSPSRSKPSVVNAGHAAFRTSAIPKILYCAWFFVALLGCVVSCAIMVTAQEERPQITPGERKAPRKKDAGPRAVAVLQLAPNGKATLVPIAILIGSKFWDATAYKADPIPMALESGTVYEAERSGSSLGLFTVNGALHSNAVNVQSPWIGTGAWVPAGTEKAKTSLKAEAVPLGIDTSDTPPRLSRSGSGAKETPSPTSSPAPAPAPAPQGTAAGPAGSGQKSQENTSPSQTGSSPSATPTPAAPPDSKSSDSKPGGTKPPDLPSTPQSDSGANEANRPRLRRGKPVEPLPQDEVPGYSKPGAAVSKPTAAIVSKPSEPTEDKTPVQLIPAISDAGGAEPKSFAFEWLKDEEAQRLQQMTTLAKEQIRAYVEAQAKAKTMPAPKSAGPKAVRRVPPSKTPAPKGKDPILENVQMKAYDLWGNNQAVLVLTAEAHMPPPPAGIPHAAADSDLQYSIVLVANPDIYNNLHKLYVSVADKYHLDITPRLELVDALDADGDGRGELLFREISDNGNGWIIYRATADKLWKMFDSLNPE